MKIILSILLLFVISFPAKSQNFSDWKNYTSMQSVSSIQNVNEGIWAATSGGGFFYNTQADTFKTLHKTDGLTGINLTAVTVDKFGKVWFGSSNGVIDVYNPATNTIKSILDIYNSDKSSNKINQMIASGDTIYVATDFGISLIDPKNYVFYDTFVRFGTLNSNIRVNSIILSNLIYACTESGIAIQKQGAFNLSAPESWNVYTTNDGLPSRNVNKIVFFDNTLVAATSNGLSILSGSRWTTFLPQFNNINIPDILVHGDSLYIISNQPITDYITKSTISSYSNGTTNTKLSSTFWVASKLDYSNNLGLIAATSRGVIKLDASTDKFIYPNGPMTNQFPEMSVDTKGNLWCSSGTDVSGIGYYEFNGSTWKNVNVGNDTSLSSNALFSVYAAPDNSIYFGTWGKGFIKLKPNNTFENFGLDVTGMTGYIGDPNYLVITGFGVDSKNNVWILNYGAVDRKILTMLSPDSTFYHFIVPAQTNQYYDHFFNLAIDQYDTKWFACTDANRSGLYYFNENKTYDNTSDDKSGYLTTSSGLNSNSVNSIVVDRRGDVWVGTSLGVNVITNTSTITSESTPQLSISSIFSLRQQTVNCIAVDPLNDKWVGTNQGLLLVNSDGSSLLAALNTKNSPLLSDIIRSIAIDPNTGTVYVGTDNGITAFKTSAIKPKDSFSNLFIYPSPFIISNGSNKITIDGLIRDSDIKILNVEGKLVKEFSSPGGRVAFWDGRDSNGNLVNSGIYIVVAFDKDGNNVTTGKIAILRK